MNQEVQVPNRHPSEWLAEEAAGDEELLRLLERREELFIDAAHTGEGIRNEAKVEEMDNLLVAIAVKKGLHREP